MPWSLHPPVPILENQDRRLVYLDGQVLACRRDCVVHVGLLTGGDAAMDLTQHATVQHLEQNLGRAGFRGGRAR